MSIVKLKKITIYGCFVEKLQILDDLQSLGCLHIVPLATSHDILDKSDLILSSQAREALKHLKDCPQKLKQIKESPNFDPNSIEKDILENKNRFEELKAEEEFIKGQIEDLKPWGSFVIPDSKDLGGLKLWFYIIPHDAMKDIRKDISKQIVNKDNLFCYVVIISEDEPAKMHEFQAKLSNKPLNELAKRLDQIEFELENLQLQRINLTRWLLLFESNLFKLENKVILTEASTKTLDKDPIFAIQGWISFSDTWKVQEYAKKKSLAVSIEDPQIGETPPTLLENKDTFKGGEDLLSFYMTPSYWLWDPSTTIFFSFAIFFAMIFSDAGYSIILGTILTFYWKRLGKSASGKRFRNVLFALTIFSFTWGVLVGSYFGIAPSEEHYLSYLKIIDMNNYSAMMALAILVGVIHITIANLTQAWSKRKSLTAIANLGWALALIGASLAFMGVKYPSTVSQVKTIGLIFIFVGLLSVVLFTSIEKPGWKRILQGFIALTRISGMFGDVLSYLRLFALGLASASLAAVFNDLAKQIYHAIPGFKILFALLILLIGHAMNFVLSLMSGFIHGLRLNFIEFFNWSLPEEGTPFKTFQKKEMSKWTQ